ncbi:MAG: glycosyltransferase family 39 protein [Myxococcaceae bacterium]|nr:glycosyltransferase family 39 protein [Myxococcaceae bacterium]
MSRLERFTSGAWRWFWCLLPLILAMGALFLYRGTGRYSPPDFGGPEPIENHRAALEILDHGTTDMTFHATGYAYLVALVYAVAPHLPLSMLIVQCLLLPLIVLAISRIARGLGGEDAGRWGLIVGGLYYPFAYYAMTFSTIVPASLASTGLVAVALPLLERTSWKRSLAVGLLLGVAACCRPNLAFLGVVLAASVLAASRSLVATLVRTAPVAAVSLGMLTAMAVANPPEPGQFTRGSQGMNRSLLDATYQFEDRWFDWERVGDPQANAKANEHWARLEAESGKPMTDPATQLLARRDAFARMKANPMGVVKKGLISSVRIWILMPSDSQYTVLKFGIALSELAFLLVALFGMRASRRAGLPWYFGAGVMLVPTLSHLILHVEPRYSLPGRGAEAAFLAIGLAALLAWQSAKAQAPLAAPAAPKADAA